MNTEQRFWNKVSKLSPSECWPWTAAKSDHGYGYFGYQGRVQGAHRVAYMLSVGPIPEDAVLDHTCHNDTDCGLGDDCPHRACCNPAHLEPVTQKVNYNRGDRRNEPLKTHCPRGHEFTPDNTYSRTNAKGYTARTCRTCERERLRRIRAGKPGA